jgi:hypothetical protein
MDERIEKVIAKVSEKKYGESSKTNTIGRADPVIFEDE